MFISHAAKGVYARDKNLPRRPQVCNDVETLHATDYYIQSKTTGERSNSHNEYHLLDKRQLNRGSASKIENIVTHSDTIETQQGIAMRCKNDKR